MSFTFVPVQSLLPTCCKTEGLKLKYFRNHEIGCWTLQVQTAAVYWFGILKSSSGRNHKSVGDCMALKSC